jgi:hypothetical protein
MIKSYKRAPLIIMEEVTDPQELAMAPGPVCQAMLGVFLQA